MYRVVVGSSRMRRGHPMVLQCVVVALGGVAGGGASAARGSELLAAVEFNSAMLRSPVDTRVFAQGNPVPAGVVEVELYVNQIWEGHAPIEFRLPANDSRMARPCYDQRLLDLLGFDPHSHALREDELRCEPLASIVADADARYDAASLRLDVTAPQARLQRAKRSHVDPALWDRGISAATLQYSYNGFRAEVASGPTVSSHYLMLRGGMNWQDWRLRWNGTGLWGGPTGFQYRHSQTYLQRSLVGWRSQLTLGDAVSDGRVFDSVAFRGVQLASDERMYDDSQRGFAPVIRGIANSNARVRVMQRGIVIHEITVPPGAFLIDDLYPTGSSGDLLVTVTEADGSQRSFTVAYSSVAELLRPGVVRYGLTVGQFRHTPSSHAPYLLQGTLRRGFSNWLTGYSGLMAAQGYSAAAVGVALNTPIGALSADVTQARSELGDGLTRQGHGLRASYSRMIAASGTQVDMAAHRYSSGGFYNASETFLMRDGATPETFHGWSRTVRRRHRLQIGVAQSLPNQWGHFNLSASAQDYWQRSGSDVDFQIGYHRQIGDVSLSVHYGRARRLDTGATEGRGMVTVSMPLGARSTHTPSYSASLVSEKNTQWLGNSLSGTWGDAQQFSYNAHTTLANPTGGERSLAWGSSAAWSAPYAIVSGSYARGPRSAQYGASISGGIVAYADGVVLAPTLGDTSAIIVAEHAGGARVVNANGVRLDDQGRAVVPYLSPYRHNAVELDPSGLSTDVELKVSSQNVAPTAGAVSLLTFPTEIGYSVLLQGQRENGVALPFGAALVDDTGRLAGFVGQAGKALVRVVHKRGVLRAQWGDRPADLCEMRYELPPDSTRDAVGFRRLDAVCVAQFKETS